MNEKSKGQVRHVLGAIGAAVVALGATDQATANEVINAVMVVGGVASTVWAMVWSWWAKRNEGKDEAMPEAYRKSGGFSRVSLLAIVAALMLGAGALSSCALVEPGAQIKVDEKATATAQAAQHAVNEGYVLLTASYNVVADNVGSGVMTKDEGRGYIEKLDGFKAKLDAAHDLLKGGKALEARDKAELLRSLILALHKEVAAKARKEAP